MNHQHLALSSLGACADRVQKPQDRAGADHRGGSAAPRVDGPHGRCEGGAAAHQRLLGIEQNSWRWTARQFSVVLRPPFGAAQRGARLELALTVPKVVTDKLKTVSLSATVDGHTLPPESYTQDGQFVYKRDLPPDLVSAESVRIDFQLDKAIPPTAGDQRELGVVVLTVALQPK